MAAINWTNVTDEAPELATGTSVNAQNALLLYVNTILAVDGFGGEANQRLFLARVYLAAHMATMLRRRGIAGFTSEKHAGPVGESFGMIQLPMLGEFGMTSYGVLYMTVCRGTAHRAGLLV